MSQLDIRAALELALDGMTPAIATSWENDQFIPPGFNVPYQQSFVMFNEPVELEMGHQRHQELGIYQINLCYPAQVGPRDAAARAELIRTTFYRTRTFVNNGVNVVIERTPTIGQGQPVGDRWVVPVKIRFYAYA